MAERFVDLVTPPIHVDETEAIGMHGEYPMHLVAHVATDVVRTLASNGLDPSTVYFRARTGEHAENANEIARNDDRINNLGRDSYPVHPDDERAESDPYEDILSEAVRKQQAQEDALGRQIDGPESPSYALGNMDALFEENLGVNPICAAGVTDDSWLDLYDKTIVSGMLEYGVESWFTEVVSVPPAQLALAALGRIRIDYAIVNQGI